MKKITCVIQARTSSTRLKNKILLNLDEENNLTILDSVINRVKKSKYINNIILAIPNCEEDKILVNIAKKHNVSCFAGPLENVLERFYLATENDESDYVMRITSDCPFIDYNILDELVIFHQNNEYRYSSNCFERTFPHGYDAEIFDKELLVEAYNNATMECEKEHVTPYMYVDKEIGSLKCENNYSNIRITVDCEEDYELVKLIYKMLVKENPFFGLTEIVSIYEKNNWLNYINKNVYQKKISMSNDEKSTLIQEFLLKTGLSSKDLKEFINEKL